MQILIFIQVFLKILDYFIQKMHQNQMKLTNTFITFTQALKFASYKHRFQRRKNEDIPYINHPIQVASILANAGVTDYNILSAAILHDTVEDTDTTPEQLEKQFGPIVKNLVLECSDDKSLSKVERKRVQIKKSLKASNQAKLIKIGDKLSNCWDLHRKAPPSWSAQRIKGYYLWAHAVCQSLRGVNDVLDKKMDELFQTVGVNKFNEQDTHKKLDEYYVILGNDKSEK